MQSLYHKPELTQVVSARPSNDYTTGLQDILPISWSRDSKIVKGPVGLLNLTGQLQWNGHGSYRSIKSAGQGSFERDPKIMFQSSEPVSPFNWNVHECIH